MGENKKQVIILGGGPAGSFAALHLVSKFPELAEDIVLLEAKHQGRDKICAGGVSGRVILGARKDLGIDISSLPGKDVNGMDARFRDKTCSPDKEGVGKVIRRNLLDSWLLNHVKERGVTVLTETPATDIRRNSNSVSVETRNGRCRLRPASCPSRTRRGWRVYRPSRRLHRFAWRLPAGRPAPMTSIFMIIAPLCVS